MPIIAGADVTAPNEDLTPPTPVWTEDIGTIAAAWIDPDGNEWPLSNTSDDVGWFTINGPAGWGATPIEIVTDPLPRGGDQVRFIRSKPRQLQWPIYIGGYTHMEFVNRDRALTRAITMTTRRRAPGWLRIARPDGTARQIACYYQQGLEGEAREKHTYAKPMVQFFCPDGFWEDTQPTVVRRVFGSSASFYSPFMTVTSSKVLAGSPDDPATEILNDGDVEAWPTWTITGPMTKLTAVNSTVGGRFALTYPLAADQIITITTNRPTVRGPGSLNLTRYIDWFNTAGTELWPLADGTNLVSFQVDGAAAGTKIELSFTKRYDSA